MKRTGCGPLAVFSKFRLRSSSVSWQRRNTQPPTQPNPTQTKDASVP